MAPPGASTGGGAAGAAAAGAFAAAAEAASAEVGLVNSPSPTKGGGAAKGAASRASDCGSVVGAASKPEALGGQTSTDLYFDNTRTQNGAVTPAKYGNPAACLRVRLTITLFGAAATASEVALVRTGENGKGRLAAAAIHDRVAVGMLMAWEGLHDNTKKAPPVLKKLDSRSAAAGKKKHRGLTPNSAEERMGELKKAGVSHEAVLSYLRGLKSSAEAGEGGGAALALGEAPPAALYFEQQGATAASAACAASAAPAAPAAPTAPAASAAPAKGKGKAKANPAAAAASPLSAAPADAAASARKRQRTGPQQVEN